MDQSTHDVRRSKWHAVITQCQERPGGMTVKQWLADNGVKEKAYYYWLRKFRKEAYDQMQVPAASGQKNEVSFAEIPVLRDCGSQIQPTAELSGPAAVIRCGSLTVALSNDISESLLSGIFREVSANA